MSLFAPTFETLEELYLNELRDLYSAETQLIDALPKMATAATSPDLKKAFSGHLEETRGHVSRLEQIFMLMGKDPGSETCTAMKGLISEGSDYVKAGGNDSVRDAGLIGAAQRVEHYEIAAYGTTKALARRLGQSTAVELLQATLEEESAADHKLTSIAENQVNEDAAAVE